MTDGSNSECGPISRRRMLKNTVDMGSLALFGGISLGPRQWVMSKVFRELSKVPNVNEKFLPDEEVDGIEVYGRRSPLNTEEDVRELHDFFNRLFLFNARIGPDSIHGDVKAATNLWEMRERLLPEKERLLQVYVKRSLYEKFEKEKKDGTGVSFPTYLKAHMDILNEFHARVYPPTKLRGKISRIIVVDDSFDDRIEGRKLPYHYYIAPYRYHFYDAPYDVDSLQTEWWDTRGDTAPDGSFQKSSFIRNEKRKGKELFIDYGRVHKWEHELFNWPDEYIENVESVPDAPKLLINHAGGTYARTPWFGYCLRRNEALKIRGYYTDPRAIGIAGQRSDSDNVLKIWGEHPERIQFYFEDEDGKPIKGKIQVSRVKTRDGVYRAEKWFEECAAATLENGVVMANQLWFEPMRSGYDETFPTNWIFQVSTNDGRNYLLHFPVAAFNMTKLEGHNRANYKIRFYNGSLDLSNVKTQVLNMTPTNYPLYFQDESLKYASMDVDGTPWHFEWRNSPESLGYGTDKS